MGKTHLDHLSHYVPNLNSAHILDLGSGKGVFLLEAAQRGARVTGLETSSDYIRIAEERLRTAGYSPDIVQGVGEKLPFAENTFDFINIGEVIEHVDDPKKMLNEAYRVLRWGGHAYISAPNRFGFRDQHFRLYFVNWLPRFLADPFITVFGTHKNYGNDSAGRQRLSDMHYYTYGGISRLVKSTGFSVQDMRVLRIQREIHGIRGIVLRLIYPLARAAYLDAFHLLLTKPSSSES